MTRMVPVGPVKDRREEYLAASPPPSDPPGPGMVWVPGGEFLAGSEGFYPEEAPPRPCTVSGFWMDARPVTNGQFAAFVKATNYRTTAEQEIRRDGRQLAPHGIVFVPPKEPVSLDDPSGWWRMVYGASWRAPRGPRAPRPARWTVHPVVQVSYADACAYAAWAGKALPSEQEWEFAARSGLDGAVFAWGNTDRTEGDAPLANRWLGRFPHENLKGGGHRYTSPAGSFPANRYGIFDLIGNVWEWTSTPQSGSLAAEAPAGCGCGGKQGEVPRHVLKGGSHLCAPTYCFRYRPAAKSSQEIDTSTSHIGFRCIVRPG
jgi:formylglycine-generating enzyme